MGRVDEAVIKTAFTALLGIQHPIALAGMSGATSPRLVAAVSNAGGLGIHGVTDIDGARIAEHVAAIRQQTDRPFGLNLLLHGADEEQVQAVLDARPAVLSTAWPRDDQDLADVFARAHDRGLKVMHMVPSVADAAKAAAAGADVIVAQGTDGGGHIGLMGTIVVVPAVVDEVSPVPVLAAGGIADGHGLAAALALGASGVLVGTRFLATDEAPMHENFKQLIVGSDGGDTIVTDIADIFMGVEWPGAVERVARNRAVERWMGRTSELRRRREEVLPAMRDARRKGDVDEAIVYWGQSAALINSVVSAEDVVVDMVREAEQALRALLPGLDVD